MSALQLLNGHNSLTHYAKGTPFYSDCFTHITSSSFHSIRNGSFHLSLTVLFTINQRHLYIVRKWFFYFQFLFVTFFLNSQVLVTLHLGYSILFLYTGFPLFLLNLRIERGPIRPYIYYKNIN